MLNPIEKFKVAILHLNRDWNHCDGLHIARTLLAPVVQLMSQNMLCALLRVTHL